MVKSQDNLPHDEPPVSWNKSHALVHRSGSSVTTNNTTKLESRNNLFFLSFKYNYYVQLLTFLPDSTDVHSGGGGWGTRTSPTATTRGTLHGRRTGLGLGDTGRGTCGLGAGVSRCWVVAANRESTRMGIPMSSLRCTYKKGKKKKRLNTSLKRVTFTVRHTALYHFIILIFKINTYTIMAP